MAALWHINGATNIATADVYRASKTFCTFDEGPDPPTVSTFWAFKEVFLLEEKVFYFAATSVRCKDSLFGSVPVL
jgi:hypothetical protein